MLTAVSSGKLIRTPQSLPKRTETFHGFDHSSGRRMTDVSLEKLCNFAYTLPPKATDYI